jgi:hypothetical protein
MYSVVFVTAFVRAKELHYNRGMKEIKKYLVEFVGYDFSYGGKDWLQFQIDAESVEEAKELALKRKSFEVLSEVSVKEL